MKRDILLVLFGISICMCFAPALRDCTASWLLYAIGTLYIIILWIANLVEEDNDD